MLRHPLVEAAPHERVVEPRSILGSKAPNYSSPSALVSDDHLLRQLFLDLIDGQLGLPWILEAGVRGAVV
jgi:hypothetical protein